MKQAQKDKTMMQLGKPKKRQKKEDTE